MAGFYADDTLITNRVLFPDNCRHSQLKAGGLNPLQDPVKPKDPELEPAYCPLELYENLRRTNEIIYGGKHPEDDDQGIVYDHGIFYKDFVNVDDDGLSLV